MIQSRGEGNFSNDGNLPNKPFRVSNQHALSNNFDVHTYAKQQPADYGHPQQQTVAGSRNLQQQSNNPNDPTSVFNDAVAEEEARNAEFLQQQRQSLVFPQRQKQQHRISINSKQ